MSYRVTLGRMQDVLADEEARAMWDATPEGLRTGRRDGAFILWDLDELGRRTFPIICRPVRADQVGFESPRGLAFAAAPVAPGDDPDG